MKTTIEITASSGLLEAINKLSGASSNLLEASKLLKAHEPIESNILTDQLNKACDLLGSCIEECSKDSLAANTAKKESEASPETETIDLTSIRALAKEKCKIAGREAVKSLITNLGADHLDSLDESKYQELFNQLKAL